MMMRIKELREARGLRRRHIADALGISTTAVAKWETGLALPSADKLPKLARFFNVSIDALYGREPPGGMEKERDAS